MPPLEATRKAMSQISGAIIGVTVVLISVFVPLASSADRSATSIASSRRDDGGVDRVLVVHGAVADAGAVRDVAETGGRPPPRKRGFFGWFNRGFKRRDHRLRGVVSRFLRWAGA